MYEYFVYADEWLIGAYKDARTAKNLCKRLYRMNSGRGDRIAIHRVDEYGAFETDAWLTADKLLEQEKKGR